MTETDDRTPTRPAPFFVCGHNALDFMSTKTAPWGEEIDWISNGEDLLKWLDTANLVPSEVVQQFRQEFQPQAMDEVASQARELRDWFRGFVEARAQQPLSPDDLAEVTKLNDILASDDQYLQIQANGAHPPFLRRMQRRWRAPKDLLLPLAEVMGDIICSADFSLIKNCEWPACNLYFLDVSKNGKRRWCTMSVCGNRAKAAAHRARKKQ